MEFLEQRVMLSVTPAVISNPISPPPLPLQPTPLQGIVGTPNSLDPALLDAAYGLDELSFNINGVISKANGAGETIAIVDAFGSPTIVQDAETFDAETFVSPGESVAAVSGGLSNYDAEGNFFLTVQKLNPTAATPPDSVYANDTIDFPYGKQGLEDEWALETSLDVEWVHAAAPGAHILLVEAPSDTTQDLLDADVYAAEQPGVVAVSDSFGGNVGTQIINGNLVTPATLDGYLVTPTGHTDNDGLIGGVTFLASSGDPKAGQTGDNFPAASRNVLSVGGYLTTIDLDGVIENIGPWTGSQGGPSTTSPTYNNPIVAADAAPDTGVWIYDSNPDPVDNNGSFAPVSWAVIGGTSLACPIWAGVVGIIDQGLNLRGYGSMTTAQTEGLVPYDNRGTTDPGDEGPNLYNFSTGGFSQNPNVNPDDWDYSGFGILGLTENSADTWGDLVQPPNVMAPQDTSFPLWGHKTNSTTISTVITQTTTTPNPGQAVPDIVLTPVNGNTGWGYPNEFNGASPRGGFIQDMVGGPTIADGNPVTIYSDSLDSLYFTQQPSNTQVGQPIDSNGLPELVVTAFSPTTDAVDQSFNGAVTIQILESGTLIGTTTVTAVNGSAVFANLSIDQEGTYEFVATSADVNPAYSNAFNETATVATHLVVTQQPTSFWQYSTMPTSITVIAEDRFNDLSYITNGANVVMSILTGPPGGILTGRTTATMTNGIATFSGIGATLPGTYTVEFRFGSLTPAGSVSFAEVPIPVTTTRTPNGAVLSEDAILFQQVRNSEVYASEGPPSAAQAALVISEDNNLLLEDLAAAATTRTSVAAVYGAKDSASPLFANASSGSNLEAQLLDVLEMDKLLG